MSGKDPAFPVVKSKSDTILGFESDTMSEVVSTVYSEGGLTKRELFAAMAMQGHLSALAGDNHCSATLQTAKAKGKKVTEFLAETAVQSADALLAELEKEVKP
jgi:hypothetical protein